MTSCRPVQGCGAQGDQRLDHAPPAARFFVLGATPGPSRRATWRIRRSRIRSNTETFTTPYCMFIHRDGRALSLRCGGGRSWASLPSPLAPSTSVRALLTHLWALWCSWESNSSCVQPVCLPCWASLSILLAGRQSRHRPKGGGADQFHDVPGAVSALADCAANELVVRLRPETIYWKVLLPGAPLGCLPLAVHLDEDADRPNPTRCLRTVVNKVPGLKFGCNDACGSSLRLKFDETANPCGAYERLLRPGCRAALAASAADSSGRCLVCVA